jgi:adenylate cyclase class 2
MYVEIETKLKVDSLDKIEAKLRSLNAEFVEQQRQVDQHYDDAHRTMATTDQCLRLRTQKVNDTTKYIITYKGPKEKSDVKKRQEIEVVVDDAVAAEKILSVLGYKPVLAIEKTRRLWKLDGCEVALDRLELLGDFVEIEGPSSEMIAAVKDKLGLSHLPHIRKSYAGMVSVVLRDQGGQINKPAKTDPMSRY